MAISVKDGTVMTAADQYKADVLIGGEKIVGIGSGLEGRVERVIDAHRRD